VAIRDGFGGYVAIDAHQVRRHVDFALLIEQNRADEPVSNR